MSDSNRIIERARAIYGSDDIHVDDEAVVYQTDFSPDHHWVQAWVRVPKDDAALIVSTSGIPEGD